MILNNIKISLIMGIYCWIWEISILNSLTVELHWYILISFQKVAQIYGMVTGIVQI